MKLSVPSTASAFVLMCAVAVSHASPKPDPIRSSVESLNARSSLESVRESPVPGLKEVRADGQVLYFTEDGEHMLVGDIYRVKDRANLTELSRSRVRAELLAESDPKTHITYGNPKAKDVVYVFTDSSCPYCQRWHDNVDELTKAGVRVEYLAWPRGGSRSPAMAEMEAVWCAKDRAKAYDDLIAGTPSASDRCSSPVMSHYALGEKVGVRGTPAVFTADGRQIGGYTSAATILEALAAQ